jgi:hypothetical protein
MSPKSAGSFVFQLNIFKMKMITLTLFAAFLITISFAQQVKETQVPAAVKNAFQKQYPNVSKVKWDKEKAKYEASFDVSKVANSVLFEGSGAIIETETSIPLNQLPKGIRDYVITNYKGQKINGAAKITDAKGVVSYEAEIKKSDLLFDASGKFLKEVKG